MEVFQGIRHADQVGVGPDALQLRRDLSGGHSALCQAQGIPHQDLLTQGGVQAVHHVYVLKFLRGHHGALVGAGESAGKGDGYHRFTCLLRPAEGSLEFPRRHQAGGGETGIGGQPLVKGFVIDGLPVPEFLAAKMDGQGHDGETLRERRLEIRAGIRNNAHFFHGFPFYSSRCAR